MCVCVYSYGIGAGNNDNVFCIGRRERMIRINKTNTGWTFHVVAKNGEIVATSETYKTKFFCKRGARSVAKNTLLAAVRILDQGAHEKACPRFEVYHDEQDKIRFRFIARNGRILCSSEPYSTISAAMVGIEAVRKNAQGEWKE